MLRLALGFLALVGAALACDKGEPFEDDSCSDSTDLEGLRGDKCCNSALGDLMTAVIESADDPMTAAEEMRSQAEEKFGCDWECIAADCDIGFANYKIKNKHCLIRVGEKIAICYMNSESASHRS